VIPEQETQAPEPSADFDLGTDEPRSPLLVWLTRLVFALVIPAILLGLIWAASFIRDPDSNRVLVVVAAIVVGVLGVFMLYKGMDAVVDRLPRALRESVRPWVFVGPALAILTIYLVYPAINTTVLSFKDARGRDFVGFDNFRHIFTDSSSLTSLRNSVLWIIVVPFFAVAIGLTFATLADKLGKRTENAAKSIIFMPMAISMVGASIVWLFVYSFRPPGFGEQIGILNGIWTGLGREPVNWLLTEPWNNLFLMVILVWLQTGFAMVILSAAIKAVPEDIIEAARIDGASEFQVFWRVTFPTIASTVVVVATTITITVWKVFDIVFVMTGGRFGTSVVAERMVTEFFTFRNTGRGAAFAVILFIAVIPIMAINVRRFRIQEELR
jgi:alpha-glucoside transport system permease protein